MTVLPVSLTTVDLRSTRDSIRASIQHQLNRVETEHAQSRLFMASSIAGATAAALSLTGLLFLV